jgi:hypothetical protein
MTIWRRDFTIWGLLCVVFPFSMSYGAAQDTSATLTTIYNGSSSALVVGSAGVLYAAGVAERAPALAAVGRSFR